MKPSNDLKEAFKKIKKEFLIQMKTKNYIGPPIDFKFNLEAKETFLDSLSFVKITAEMAEKRFKYLDNKELLDDRKKYKIALKELHLKQKEEYKEYFEMESKKYQDIIYNKISKQQLLNGLNFLWKEKRHLLQFALDILKETDPENYQKADNAFKEVCERYDRYLN